MDLKYFRPTDEVWTSIKYLCDDKRYFYLNWNRAAATPETKQTWKPSRNGLFYYGMCRPDRMDLLKEYFGPQVSYPVRIVSSKSDIVNWAKINKGIQFSLYNEPKTFNIFNMTIYMIDKWMEGHDCSVARRFYENFNNGVPMLFDRRAIKQLENEKIMVHDSWVVDNHIDVTNKLPDYVTIQRKQQEYYGTVNWYGRFVKDFKYLAKQRGL
jgi:hypothetical protein